MEERFVASALAKRIDEEAARWAPAVARCTTKHHHHHAHDQQEDQEALPRMAFLLIKNVNGRGPVATLLKKKFGDVQKENVGVEEVKEMSPQKSREW